MAVALDRSLIRAINAEMNTKLGRRYDRWARKRYGVQGKLLAAKTVAGEGGGRSTKKMRRLGIVSSAGARGPAQFIASTRQAYIEQHGVDPWKNDRSAIRGMMIHHLSTGVEGYNPGMPTYKDYILGQRIDKGSWRALKQGKGGGRASGGRRRLPGKYEAGTPGRLVAETLRSPDISLEPQREALKMQTLTTALGQGRLPSQQELLSMAAGMRELDDISGETTVSLRHVPGRKGRQGKGRMVGGRRRGGGRGRDGMPREAGGHYGKIFEAFFDPAGEYFDSGQFVKGAIGGHGTHVHVSASPRYVDWLGRRAQKMGLHVGENETFDPVDPVHTDGSFHYRNRAIDVSGDARKMRKFYRFVMEAARHQ